METDNENKARMALDKHFEAYIEATGNITTDVVDSQIYKAMDQFELGLSNFWRMQSFYFYKYRRYLKSKKGV